MEEETWHHSSQLTLCHCILWILTRKTSSQCLTQVQHSTLRAKQGANGFQSVACTGWDSNPRPSSVCVSGSVGTRQAWLCLQTPVCPCSSPAEGHSHQHWLSEGFFISCRLTSLTSAYPVRGPASSLPPAHSAGAFADLQMQLLAGVLYREAKWCIWLVSSDHD